MENRPNEIPIEMGKIEHKIKLHLKWTKCQLFQLIKLNQVVIEATGSSGAFGTFVSDFIMFRFKFMSLLELLATSGDREFFCEIRSRN